MNGSKDVIVGIDGGDTTNAVRWAAAEAARTDGPLRIVFAGHRGPAPEPAEAAVTRAIATARACRPGLDVTSEVVAGAPVDVLTGLASAAALIVVGSHGHNALAEGLYGATGTRVAMR